MVKYSIGILCQIFFKKSSMYNQNMFWQFFLFSFKYVVNMFLFTVMQKSLVSSFFVISVSHVVAMAQIDNNCSWLSIQWKYVTVCWQQIVDLRSKAIFSLTAGHKTASPSDLFCVPRNGQHQIYLSWMIKRNNFLKNSKI